MAAERGARHLIGVSGWTYDRWRGDFYPEGLARRRELEHVASRLPAVEVNGTFYALQRPATFERWAAQVPDDFVFALKGSRYVTHLRRLVDVRTALANFFASGLFALGSKLGPIVWQLPASIAYDRALIEDFLALLPRTTGEAAVLAREHDDRLPAERALTDPVVEAPIHHALEVRHPSFADDDFASLLRGLDVAGVWSDAPTDWPVLDLPSSSIAYARLHGHTRLYASRYSDASLDAWAERCRQWHDRGLEVHVYFDNDSEGHAPHDAERLLGRIRHV
ncbi:MAG: DUF72 domain-containing protein [Aeromicrobium sp.]